MVDATAPDEALFAAVRGALDSGPVAPSPASVHALRLAVLEKWAALDVTPARSRAGWWSRRSAVVAVVTAAFTLGGGTVALARPALPRPLRDVARMAGWPVNPEPADRVRIERAELERSLDAGNVTRVRTELEDLDRAESKLTPPQRARAQAADDDLEQRARTITGAQTGEDGARSATPAPARPEPSETAPASSPPAPTNDDRPTTTTGPAAPPSSSGEATTGGTGSPGDASPPSGQESPATTTTRPPSATDDTHSMSMSSTTTEVLQTTTVDH